MNRKMLCLMALIMVFCTANAQRLVLKKSYGSNYSRNAVTLKNKPNGIIYRVREEKQCTDLPVVPEAEKLMLIISERIDIGWLALYRLPMGDDNYDFVAVVYDEQKKPLYTVNLCDITDNRYCEVQDIRWDEDTHHLLFNMACPSYAEMIGGKGSKLYCYDVQNRRMVWETAYLVSNGIFILNRDYVFCSYGFTSEKKFLYMIDKRTGTVYSKLPMTYKVEYMELVDFGGYEELYVIDYQEHLFTFTFNRKTAADKTATDKAQQVFTVVYTTSEDGFLNVRSQPSMKGAIVEKVGIAFHGLGNGVLREKGTTWSKVSVGNVTGWVYNKYLATQSWYDGSGKHRLIAKHDVTPIYGENYQDADGGYPQFTTVKKGTIIADQYDETAKYYVLKTGHDYLFIDKNDVVVK